MRYTSLVYNMLPNAFWNITPVVAGAGGAGDAGEAVGTRRPVGSPEIIPDVTFIARELRGGDGFSDKDRDDLNDFIQGGKRLHALYGLAPITINSLDDLLRHFDKDAPIGRIRLVSHGNFAFLFLPLFTEGRWSFGMQADRLEAFQNKDEEGLRFLVNGNPTQSPLLVNIVTDLVAAIRAFDSTLLAPFGLATGGVPTGELLSYFEIVNDLYQIHYGTVVAESRPPTVVRSALTEEQRKALTASLNLIETKVRERLDGTVSGTITLTAPVLKDFKDAVLGLNLVQLGFLGEPVDLASTVIAEVKAALLPNPPSEPALRVAISGAEASPLLVLNYIGAMIQGLQTFAPDKLKLGGVVYDDAKIRGDRDILAFAEASMDLHHLKNGVFTIGGTPINTTQKDVLHTALIAITGRIRTRIRGRLPNISVKQLDDLREAIETRPMAESALTGVSSVDLDGLADLKPANTAIQDGFRDRLNHFRDQMQAGNASKLDIRGCLVGRTALFLDLLRKFLGTSTNQPTVTAPDWFQSFPASALLKVGPPLLKDIDGLVASGRSALHIKKEDVAASMTEWSGLIEFEPHFSFIAGLFAPGASKLDFASLRWRVWKSQTHPDGIPVLRMEAARIDDIAGLTLGKVIARFQLIFDVPAGSTPDLTVQERLTELQPHLATFQKKSAALTSATAPSDQLITELAGLAASITAVGFSAPATPLTAPAAGATLQQIRDFATAIRGYIDTILNGALDAFFAYVQGQNGLQHANARIRYYLNIGLPLPVQSRQQRTSWAVTSLVSAPNAETAVPVIAAAFRSWMRIQWTGSPPQLEDMNAIINGLPIATGADQGKAAQGSMLSHGDPVGSPTSDAAFAPTEKFRLHVVTRP